MSNTVTDAPAGDAAVPEETASRSSWSSVFAMSVCAFALIASEFLPVSLLTPIASDLRITEGMAGQGIAISGAFAVLTSLFISVLAGGLNRKTLLLGLTAAMGASGAVIGWRGAFLCLVPVALVTLAWQWMTLPSMHAAARARGIGNAFKVFTLFKRPGVTVGMLASSLLFMGQFSLFTYVRPFLETVTDVHGAAISLVLLVIGAAGFIGTVLIGRVLQRGFFQTLIAIPLLMALIALALIAFGEWTAAVVALLGVWGLAGTSAPVGWWAWIAKVFPKDAEAGGGLFVAVVQLSIALGSTLGGLLFDHSGYQSTFMFSAVLLAVCAILTALTRKST